MNDFLMTLFNTFFGIILTGLLGSYLTNKVTSYFQARANLNNINIKKAEQHIKDISDLSIRIQKSSSSRRFSMLNLIYALNDKSHKLDEIRKEYMLEKNNWNISLGTYNIELNILNLLNVKLESNVHENFVKAHYCLVYCIENKGKNKSKKIKEALEYLDNVVQETNSICFELIKESDRIWNDLKNNKSIPLSMANLHKAETWKLFLALFYNPRSNPLRIKSPLSD